MFLGMFHGIHCVNCILLNHLFPLKIKDKHIYGVSVKWKLTGSRSNTLAIFWLSKMCIFPYPYYSHKFGFKITKNPTSFQGTTPLVDIPDSMLLYVQPYFEP